MGRTLPRFEDAVDECLEGIRKGALTPEDCLARYPQWAERLEPLLRTAIALDGALAEAARDAVPDAASRADARRRFLNSAAARRLAAPPSRWPSWWAPSLRPGVFVANPIIGIALAFLVGFIGFSSYAVVSSDEALPGDWRYPIKRTSERVRMALAFDDDARREVRISFAEERLEEVERLASEQRSIPAPLLRDLARTTDSLAQSLDPAAVPEQHIQRIGELAQKQQQVLPAVQPLVDPAAADELEAALQVSEEVYALAAQDGLGGEETPVPPGDNATEASAVSGGGAAPDAAETPAESALAPSPTPEQPASPAAAASPAPVPSVAAAEPDSTPSPVVVERHTVPAPEDQTAGLAWKLVIVGDFSIVVPADPDWVVSSVGSDPLSPDLEREVLMVGHRRDGVFVAVVLIPVASGDATIQARVDGAMTRIAPEDMARLLPLEAPVIQHILESVHLGPS